MYYCSVSLHPCHWITAKGKQSYCKACAVSLQGMYSVTVKHVQCCCKAYAVSLQDMCSIIARYVQQRCNTVIALRVKSKSIGFSALGLQNLYSFVLFLDNENDYISLTDIAKYKSDDPTAVIENWLRNRNTIEYLGICESLYELDFHRIWIVYYKGVSTILQNPNVPYDGNASEEGFEKWRSSKRSADVSARSRGLTTLWIFTLSLKPLRKMEILNIMPFLLFLDSET